MASAHPEWLHLHLVCTAQAWARINGFKGLACQHCTPTNMASMPVPSTFAPGLGRPAVACPPQHHLLVSSSQVLASKWNWVIHGVAHHQNNNGTMSTSTRPTGHGPLVTGQCTTMGRSIPIIRFCCSSHLGLTTNNVCNV